MSDAGRVRPRPMATPAADGRREGGGSAPIADAGGAYWGLVVASPRQPSPTALLEGLRQRGLAVRLVHDLAQAMVELSLARPAALVVHEPSSLARLEQFLEAVRQYHPGTVCWQYERTEDGPRLSRLPAGLPPRPVRTADAMPPSPRSSPADAPASVEPRKVRESPVTAPMLTREELEMLMGPVFEPEGEDAGIDPPPSR